jgi:ribosomal protein S18 acetylase RimI-like enzyme
VLRAGDLNRLKHRDSLPAALKGLEQVLLSVTTTQIAALALYRSLGFELFGTEPRALNISGEFIDEHYLILHLKWAGN